MWQTKYALAKNLGLGVDICSEGDFLSGRPQSVLHTISSSVLVTASNLFLQMKLHLSFFDNQKLEFSIFRLTFSEQV